MLALRELLRGEYMETRRQTILIVDDERVNIEVLGETLSSDYEILVATSGPEALKIAFEQIPDLILLDIVIPDMDGYEVCARLKADSRTRAVPIIFITAMNQELDEAKGLTAGAIDYITKPIRPLTVKARVNNHMELKRYQDFLEDLSTTDGLTGIPNRRKFDEFLQREWGRALRNQTPISLVLIDIDFFKAYNDHYSHLAGDDCLRLLARTIASSVRRPTDLVARYGGEEFTCLLPEVDSEGADWVAKQILERVDNLKIPHTYSAAADHVTVSMGVATMIPKTGENATVLIQKADDLLYEAKRNGRNQIRR
jgi:diguanylate cyclase (GGDEF)-like protein